jgi:hypothetical protein
METVFRMIFVVVTVNGLDNIAKYHHVMEQTQQTVVYVQDMGHVSH